MLRSHVVLLCLALGHPLRPLASQAPRSTSGRCYDGIIGTATQARRAILVRRADSTSLEFYGRPSRSVPLRALPDSADGARWHSDPSGATRYSVRVAADSAIVESAGASRVSTGVLHNAFAGPSLASLAGDWETELGPGGILRLIVRVRLGPCGLLVGTLDSPDQGQRDLPITHVQSRRDSLVIEARYLGLRMAVTGTESSSASELRGTFSQNGTSQSLVLRRSAGALTTTRPQDPMGPRPYRERDVQFASASAGVRLAGTLTLPSGRGPHPAVVLISGSGAQDRDESIAGHRPFLVLADHLTKRGFAVLRTDDRGIGASTGRVIDARLEDLADDVHGALTFLRTVPDIDASRIGVLGHSEGGFVAPLVASRDTALRFVVLLAGPAVSGRSLLLAQHVALMRAAAEPPEVIRVDSAMLHTIFEVIDRRPAPEDLAPKVDSAVSRWLRGLSPDDRRIAILQLQQRSASQDSASIALWNSAWFRSFYFHDPVSTLSTMQRPVLALFGERDLQVPADQSASALSRLFVGPRRKLLTTRIMPGLNHLMQPAFTGLLEEYRRIDTTIAPAALDTITSWLQQTGMTVPREGRR